MACSNDRIAAPWLKPYRNLIPCTTYFSASGLAAVTFRPVSPSPSYNGSSARSDEAKSPTPRTTTARRMLALMGLRSVEGVIGEMVAHFLGCGSVLLVNPGSDRSVVRAAIDADEPALDKEHCLL